MTPKMRYLVNFFHAKVAHLAGAQFADMSASDSKKSGKPTDIFRPVKPPFLPVKPKNFPVAKFEYRKIFR